MNMGLITRGKESTRDDRTDGIILFTEVCSTIQQGFNLESHLATEFDQNIYIFLHTVMKYVFLQRTVYIILLILCIWTQTASSYFGPITFSDSHKLTKASGHHRTMDMSRLWSSFLLPCERNS